MSQNLLVGNAKLIATTCSPRHIQSVIEDMSEQLKIAAELRQQVLSLNPDCATIGAGKLAQLQSLAKQLNKVGD